MNKRHFISLLCVLLLFSMCASVASGCGGKTNAPVTGAASSSGQDAVVTSDGDTVITRPGTVYTDSGTYITGPGTVITDTGTIITSTGTVTTGGTNTMATNTKTGGSDEPVPAAPDELYKQFLNPDQSYRTKPLFFWNVPLSEMTTDKVREIVRRSYEESGYDGFGILPYWLDGYMTDEYFELYEAALDEGSKYGMQFSLYDEDGFPSYTAGGLFSEKYPELTARRLDMVENEGRAGDKVFVQIPDGTLMGAVAVNITTGERINITDLAHIIEKPSFDPDEEPLGALASSTYDITEGYGVEKAFDGKTTTRWNAYQRSGSRQWIQINYGKTVSIDKVEIFEDKNPELHRTSAFDVQIWNGEKWENIASGEKITDKGASFTFDKPVQTQIIRLYFRRITGDSATITEFNVSYKGNRIEIPESSGQKTYEPGYYSSSVYSADYDAAKAFDGDPNTRWNSVEGKSVGEWIMACYENPVGIDSVYISEALDRISDFKVEYLSGGKWIKAALGSTIGRSKEISFDKITADAIRLVMSTPNGNLPSIYEFTPKCGGETVLPQKQANVNDYTKSYIEYEIPKDAQGTWKVMCFICLNENKEGMDYLNPEAVAGYIEITHEAYYQRFKKYFENGTITSSFFDEPSFWPAGGLTAYGVEGARMWTDSLNDFFATMYKDEDPVLLYPALWYDIGKDTTECRDKLLGVRAEMFAKNYIGQIDQWCRDHGIKLMGHMLFEELVNPVSSEGDLMLCFKYQQIPGVDCITNYGFSQEAYKIISSSANNWDKRLVMCETFGAMGTGMPVNMLYKQTIDLFTKGINLIVPHAVWYDDRKNVVYPPELSYRNGKYASELRAYNDYTARLGVILQQESVHVADIAMLYPIDYLESAYLFNGTANNPSDANYMQIGENLSLTSRRDFTYLHPEVLDLCKVQDGKLVMQNSVNRESFRVFIVPGMKVISLSNLEKIYEFWKAGGSVIFAGTIPSKGINRNEDAKVKEILTAMLGKDSTTVRSDLEYTGEGKTFRITNLSSLKATLDKALDTYDVKITASTGVSGGWLSYIHKSAQGRNFYYIGNSSDTKVTLTVQLRGEFDSLELWDPATGDREMLQCTAENGVTTVRLTLDKVTSAFIVESAK